MKGQDVQDFRQYLRKNTTREWLYLGGQSSEWQNSFHVAMNILKLPVFGDYPGYSSKTEGKSLTQKAEWPKENLSADKNLKAHAGTHL